MEPTTVGRSFATGDEIEEVVAAMEPALEGRPRHHVLIACLSIAALILEPDITGEQLQSVIKGASEWMVLHLNGAESLVLDNTLPKEQLN